MPSYAGRTPRFNKEEASRHYAGLITEEDFNGYNSLTYVSNKIFESWRFEGYIIKFKQ